MCDTCVTYVHTRLFVSEKTQYSKEWVHTCTRAHTLYSTLLRRLVLTASWCEHEIYPSGYSRCLYCVSRVVWRRDMWALHDAVESSGAHMCTHADLFARRRSGAVCSSSVLYSQNAHADVAREYVCGCTWRSVGVWCGCRKRVCVSRVSEV